MANSASYSQELLEDTRCPSLSRSLHAKVRKDLLQEDMRETIVSTVEQMAITTQVRCTRRSSAFKHWSLFVEDEQDAGQSFIVHVEGSSHNFRYVQKYSDAHQSQSLAELIQVGHVHKDNLSLLRHTARRAHSE